MNDCPNKWVFGYDSQHPVLAVSVVEPPSHDVIQTMEERDVAGISRLSPLLQVLPSLATAQNVAQHNYMEVIIDGPLARVKEGGGFRGFSLGDKGIKEHAVLLDADKLGNLVNTGLLLQTASVLLAQKHLADINEKLTIIAEGVQAISDFQNNERATSIDGAIQYLRQVAPVILEGEQQDIIRHKLEDFEVQFTSIQTHLLKDIETVNNEVTSCSDPSFFGSDGITVKLKSLQDTLQKRLFEWHMATSVRVHSLQLLALYNDVSLLKKQRYNDIKKSIDRFNQLVQQTESHLLNRINGITAFTESSNATNANKTSLRKWVTLRLEKQKQHIIQLDQAFDHFNQELALAQSQPSRMIVEMKNGQPVRLFQHPVEKNA